MNAPTNPAERQSSAVRHAFRTQAVRSFSAVSISKDPIVFSHVVLPEALGWTTVLPAEPAFCVFVALSPLEKLEHKADGLGTDVLAVDTGGVLIYDLTLNPIGLIQYPLDALRFYISQRTLDEFAYDRGRPFAQPLRSPDGSRDPVLHGLTLALLEKARIFGTDDTLFTDHVALAFHAHVAEAYGQLSAPHQIKGGLSPSQFHRARDIMMARISEGVTISELATECGVPLSYFPRAFKRSTGVAAHKWLMNERVKRAKLLLLNPKLSIAEVGDACGFCDQSHLARVFSKSLGVTPAQWRRAQTA